MKKSYVWLGYLTSSLVFNTDKIAHRKLAYSYDFIQIWKSRVKSVTLIQWITELLFSVNFQRRSEGLLMKDHQCRIFWTRMRSFLSRWTNPIEPLEMELHWNLTGDIQSVIGNFMSDPIVYILWWPLDNPENPCFASDMASEGIRDYWIRRVPVGSDKILYWIQSNTSTGLIDLGSNKMFMKKIKTQISNFINAADT